MEVTTFTQRGGYHVWQAENRSWTAVKQESERLRRRRGEVEVALVGRLSRGNLESGPDDLTNWSAQAKIT